jgi:hypothetical protein
MQRQPVAYSVNATVSISTTYAIIDAVAVAHVETALVAISPDRLDRIGCERGIFAQELELIRIAVERQQPVADQVHRGLVPGPEQQDVDGRAARRSVIIPVAEAVAAAASGTESRLAREEFRGAAFAGAAAALRVSVCGHHHRRFHQDIGFADPLGEIAGWRNSIQRIPV